MNWEASKIPGVPQDKLPKTRCRAFRSAWDKGYRAGALGHPASANPYEDVRDTYRNSVTWSRAFRRYWREGWEAGRKHKTESCETCQNWASHDVGQVVLTGHHENCPKHPRNVKA